MTTTTMLEDRRLATFKKICEVWQRKYDEARSNGATDEQAIAWVKELTLNAVSKPQTATNGDS